jgi:protoporphyrin/coproporphyrin ferrochelatase
VPAVNANLDSIPSYDAIVVMSFGGPNGPDDVMPFLENVTKGRGVPTERLAEVAIQYEMFGGKSPINEQNQALIAAVTAELDQAGITLPIYWGNRNWDPFIGDTATQMVADGVTNALAFVTSAFSSYSGCRQYRQDMSQAADGVDGALTFHKIRAFWNHPGFIETMVDRVSDALNELSADDRPTARLVFTAHSIPISMATTSDYVAQLTDAATLISQAVGHADFDLVYQSRSGPPQVPWLEPDICDHLRSVAGSAIVLIPLGFISDHQEVKFDLDTQAREVADSLGLTMVRAATAGTHPRFVTMVRELIEERLSGTTDRATVGTLPARPDQCPLDCCPAPAARPGTGRPS